MQFLRGSRGAAENRAESTSGEIQRSRDAAHQSKTKQSSQTRRTAACSRAEMGTSEHLIGWEKVRGLSAEVKVDLTLSDCIAALMLFSVSSHTALQVGRRWHLGSLSSEICVWLCMSGSLVTADTDSGDGVPGVLAWFLFACCDLFFSYSKNTNSHTKRPVNTVTHNWIMHTCWNSTIQPTVLHFLVFPHLQASNNV